MTTVWLLLLLVLCSQSVASSELSAEEKQQAIKQQLADIRVELQKEYDQIGQRKFVFPFFQQRLQQINCASFFPTKEGRLCFSFCLFVCPTGGLLKTI